MFGIRSALVIWVFIRLGPDPEYSIYGKLSLWEIIRWDLIPLGKYPCTVQRDCKNRLSIREIELVQYSNNIDIKRLDHSLHS